MEDNDEASTTNKVYTQSHGARLSKERAVGNLLHA